MAQAGSKSIARHLAGLALAILLGLGCLALYLYVPPLIQGTFLQRIENMVIFAAVVALLSLAERLWVFATHPHGPHTPE